jgi:FkbM family methyltransferase
VRRRRFAAACYDWASRSPMVVRAAVRIRNISNALIGHSIIFGRDPTHNGELLLIERALPQARVVVDVGANVGDWAALALGTMPRDARLVCFEPSDGAADRLAERFREESRVEIVRAAVADAPGRRSFFEEPDAGETSSFARENTSRRAEQRVVDVTTLDAEAERMGIDRVDMLKVDCEGFDLAVLRGAERLLGERRVRLIQFEYNEPWRYAGATLSAAVALLNRHGYGIRAVTPVGPREFDYAKFGETFTYANFAAVAPGEAL